MRDCGAKRLETISAAELKRLENIRGIQGLRDLEF